MHDFMVATRQFDIIMAQFRSDSVAMSRYFIEAIDQPGHDGMMVDLDTETIAGALVAPISFSFDASGGQLPSDQGWGIGEIDDVGTIGVDANAAIVTDGVDGNVLRIKDGWTPTNPTSAADLPEYTHGWGGAANEQLLIDYGMKVTLVFRNEATAGGTNGLLRLGFTSTLFAAFDNIPATTRSLNFGDLKAVRAGQTIGAGNYHTLEVIGQKTGTNDFTFTISLDGDTPTAYSTFLNDNIVGGSVLIGATSSAGSGTDLWVKSFKVETLNEVPEPASAGLLGAGILTLLWRWSRQA
ncbi:MAG: PEP-CTERM sorting domain-containing protein [Phycisphaeraceae bacterium]|nr:PEP-CTERM sorting domain-containing protein [Phycisphaeraceae bacterium]